MTTLAKRLSKHLAPAALAEGSPKAKWLRSLAERGLRPRIDLLEIVFLDDLADAENRWIDYHLERGEALYNVRRGGGGGSPRAQSAVLRPSRQTSRRQPR